MGCSLLGPVFGFGHLESQMSDVVRPPLLFPREELRLGRARGDSFTRCRHLGVVLGEAIHCGFRLRLAGGVGRLQDRPRYSRFGVSTGLECEGRPQFVVNERHRGDVRRAQVSGATQHLSWAQHQIYYTTCEARVTSINYSRTTSSPRIPFHAQLR